MHLRMRPKKDSVAGKFSAAMRLIHSSKSLEAFGVVITFTGRLFQPKPISESSVELFPRHAWSLFARTNTFVNRLLLCLRPGELIIQQLAKALLLVGRKLWQLFKDLLETHPYM